jgi:hypothetical protein
MGHDNAFGYRPYPKVGKGSQGIFSCTPDDFFVDKGEKEEKLFYCLNCETRLYYPSETKKYYFFQELLCKDCLKLWIEGNLILLAVGRIGGVADYQIKFADLKKYNLRRLVYRVSYR